MIQQEYNKYSAVVVVVVNNVNKREAHREMKPYVTMRNDLETAHWHCGRREWHHQMRA